MKLKTYALKTKYEHRYFHKLKFEHELIFDAVYQYINDDISIERYGEIIDNYEHRNINTVHLISNLHILATLIVNHSNHKFKEFFKSIHWNCKTQNNYNLILIAAKSNNVEILDFLINEHPTPAERIPENNQVFLYCLLCKSIEAIDFFLEKLKDEDINNYLFYKKLVINGLAHFLVGGIEFLDNRKKNSTEEFHKEFQKFYQDAFAKILEYVAKDPEQTRGYFCHPIELYNLMYSPQQCVESLDIFETMIFKKFFHVNGIQEKFKELETEKQLEILYHASKDIEVAEN